MSYTIKTQLLPVGHRLRPAGNFKKSTITIHSTGNPTSTVQGERAWLENATNKRDAAWHYCVGAGLVIQAIPDNEIAWHSGVADGNKKSIGVEIIESGDRKATLETAAEFVADVLKKYGWDTKALRKHYDWTNKNCPRILIDKQYIKGGMDWEYFVARVKYYLRDDETVKTEIINIVVDGQNKPVERILYQGYNYIKIRDIADICGYNLGNKGSIPVMTKKS